MSSPVGWADETINKENHFVRLRRILGLVAILFIVMTLLLLIVNSYFLAIQPFALLFVPMVVGLVFFAVSDRLKNAPLYARLAARIYLIGNLLDSPVAAVVRRQIERMVRESVRMINEQLDELEDQELVFGATIDVLEKIRELLYRANGAPESRALPQITSNLQGALHTIGDIIYHNKTVNTPDLHNMLGAVSGGFSPIPIVVPIARPLKFLRSIKALNRRYSFVAEALLAIPITYYVGLYLNFRNALDFFICYATALVLINLVESRVLRQEFSA